MEAKRFTIIEYNEDTLVVELHANRAPAVVGALNFTHGETGAALLTAYPTDGIDEDNQNPLCKLLRLFGWEYEPLPGWQHDLIVAAMRCQMKRDDFTDKHRSLGDWFMAAAVHQADLLPPQLTSLPFSEPGCIFDGTSGQSYNDMRTCRLAWKYGWLPEDGSGYYEFVESNSEQYVTEALAYLNEHCTAPMAHLNWVDGDLMVVAKQEEEIF